MNLSDLRRPIPSSNASGLTISAACHLPDLSAGLTYTLDVSAAFGYTIRQINGIQTSAASGSTVTATIKINGSSIAGLSDIAVTI